jgi:hypothetical protein
VAERGFEPSEREACDDTIEHMQGRFGATAVKIVDGVGTAHYLKSLSRT